METTYSRDGTGIAFWRSGAGPALLLVHGTTADHTRWSPLLPLLEPHFTVYTMDRRGRGGSGDAPDYHILREAEDVAAVAEAAGEPVFVLGHSYGGTCALEASLLTGKICRLVLYEPAVPTEASTVSPDLLARLEALIGRGELEAALEFFMREGVRMPESELNAYRQLPMWKRRIALMPTTLREGKAGETYRFDPGRFANHRVPTVLLLGGESPEFLRLAVATAHAALPNSRIVVLPGQRHVAMDSDPALFVREVRRFLLDEPLPAERPHAQAVNG